MPNYHPNAKSLVYGLSDFWTLYFKEIDVIEGLYRGAEVDLGQTYLDLLSLLLTNSAQDTPLFNREYFKLLRLREDTVTYGGDGRFGVAVPPELQQVRYLNDRVFGVAHALEHDVDFVYDAAARSLLFSYDIFSAYRARTFGVGRNAYTLSATLPSPQGDAIRIVVTDSATHPITSAVVDYVVTFQVDSTRSTAADLVQHVNNAPHLQGLLRGSLPAGASGLGYVSAQTSVPLLRQATTPVEGFASRTVDVAFGSVFQDSSTPRWLDLDIQKGDILRICGGGRYGNGREFPIALVREDRLVLHHALAPEDVPGELEYAILRDPVEGSSVLEGLSPLGLLNPHDAASTVDAAASRVTFAAPASALTDLSVGDVLLLSGVANAGEYRIREVEGGGASVLVDGAPLVDETGVGVELLSPLDVHATGGTLAGTTFTAAAPAFSAADVGGWVVFVQGDIRRLLRITAHTSTTVVTVTVPAGVVDAGGLLWARIPPLTAIHVPQFAPSDAWVLPGSLSLYARRYEDLEAVQEGRDYVFDVDTGVILPQTPWQATSYATCTYKYRDAVWSSARALQDGTDGTSGPGVFSAPTLAVDASMLGYAIFIEDAATETNNGRYHIAEVLSGSSVRLRGADGLTADANNGALKWELQPRGTATVTDIVEPVVELGVWAPDVRVDRYHLYYTYGYLIDRVKTSSEAYRALIRGLFQLFMLGPTLERFESAVNTVAGLSVIRDDGEILLSYSDNALRSGNDGTASGALRTFSSPTAAFTLSDIGLKLYVPNRLYTIEAVLDPTTVRVTEEILTGTGLSWEITEKGVRTVTTSRAAYVFPRTVPLKPKFVDPANWGVLALRAFEVITAAFEVTDYVESPTWWESTTIPAQLMPGEDGERRRSSPQLFENVLGAPDMPRVGDPGFYIGADDEGIEPAVTVLDSGADGAFFLDPLWPSRSSETFFEAASAAFTENDIGNLIYVAASGVSHRILARMSATRVRVETYTPLSFNGTPLVSWELRTGTLPLRHKAAYLIFDQYLKYHMFSVRFDASLLGLVETNVLQELNELVFEAKPAYTYLVLTPSLLFEEVIRIEESLERTNVLRPGGASGETFLANENPLMLDGTWVLGSWFRSVTNTDTAALPAGSIPAPLGTPPANYEYRLARLWLDPATVQEDSLPVPYGKELPHVATSLGTADVSVVDDDTLVTLNPATGSFGYGHTLQYLDLGAPLNVRVRVGRCPTADVAVVDYPGAVPTLGVTVTPVYTGGVFGQVRIDGQGQSFFEDALGLYDFTSAAVGDHIHRPLSNDGQQRSYRVMEVVSATTLRVAQRVEITGTVTATLAGDGTPGSNYITLTGAYFHEEMAYQYRAATDLSTALKRTYYVYAGAAYRIEEFISPSTVRVAAIFGSISTSPATVYYEQHYDASSPDLWTLYRPEVLTPLSGAVTFTSGASYDAAGGNFIAEGVQVPTAPFIATFDPALDTYFALGAPAPWIAPDTRRHTYQHVQVLESPIEIRRTPAPVPLTGPYIDDGGNYYVNQDGDRYAVL